MERRLTAMLNRQGFPCEIYNVGCMYPYIDYAPRTLQYIVDHYDEKADYSRDKTKDDDFENIMQALFDYHSQNPKVSFMNTINKLLNSDVCSTMISDAEVIQRLCEKIENHSEVKWETN